MDKICGSCHLPKDINLFAKKTSAKDGRQSICKECQSEYNKNYYQENSEEIKEKTAPRRDAHKLASKQLVINYLLDHPCIDCGEKDIVVLDFDHIGDKEYNIADMIRMGFSLDAIRNEISKCVVRCANCHRRKTAKDFNWLRLMSGNNDI